MNSFLGCGEIGASWQGPVRFLFIDADHSYEAVRSDIATWARHVVNGGVMAFHDVNVSPGVTQAYQELLASNPSWKEVCRVASVGIVQHRA